MQLWESLVLIDEHEREIEGFFDMPGVIFLLVSEIDEQEGCLIRHGGLVGLVLYHDRLLFLAKHENALVAFFLLHGAGLHLLLHHLREALPTDAGMTLIHFLHDHRVAWTR